MNYDQRFNWFCYWADYYNLQIIKPKYIPDESSRDWAKDLLN